MTCLTMRAGLTVLVLSLCAAPLGCAPERVVINTSADLSIEDGAVVPVDLRKVDLGPCGGPCTGATPLCDPLGGRCVACLADKDCSEGALCRMGACTNGCTPQRGCGDAGVCQLDGGVCVECLVDGDCAVFKDPARSVCSAAPGRCVACRLANDNCPAGQYCKDDGMGGLSCAKGCKADGDCFVGDAGANVTCCAHSCVDVRTSAAHCGQCGTSCGNAPDAACCAGSCVLTGSDIKSCGACGRVCAFPGAVAVCAAGICKIGMCSPGFDDCDMDARNGCEASTGSDIKNCGGCGKQCNTPNANALCVVGVCSVGSCNPGFRNCDGNAANGCEVNSQSDPVNCGACGAACAQLPNAMAGCMGGACVVGACNPGFGNCDKMDANGCEADLSSTLANCGACGNACPMRANVQMSCAAGKCIDGGCAPGFADCDNNMGNGCEAKLGSDLSNCGVCGKVCMGMGQNAVAGCVMGACSLVCSAGFGDCDNNAGNGCEKDLRGDVNNCGACGKVCPNNAPICQAGVCTNVPSCRGPFTVDQTISLDANLFTAKHSNFHPQSIDFDPANNQIVFALQGTNTARWVDLNGVAQGFAATPAVGQNSMNYTTGIAIDGTYLFISDYTCNASVNCTDLARYTRNGQFGIANGITASTEYLAYGGYPLALGGGNLFRGNFSNSYDWTSINQIRVTTVGAPDVLLRTLNANYIARGIGDMAWDGSAIWVVGYSSDSVPNRNVDLWRVDPNNGNNLESYANVFTLKAPLRPAGIAYGNNSLYIFGYSETVGTASTLTRLGCK